MLDTDTPTPTSDDSGSEPAAPPRRRRSASRPAGPPAPVVMPEPVAPVEAETDTEVEQQVTLDVAEILEPEPRSEAEPAPEEPEALPNPDEAPSDDAEQRVAGDWFPADEVAETGEVAVQSDAVEAAPAEDPPAPRRRRSTRAAAAPKPVEAQPSFPDVDASVDAPEAPAPISLNELPTLDELAPPVEQRGRRRRPKAEAKPELLAVVDEVAPCTSETMSSERVSAHFTGRFSVSAISRRRGARRSARPSVRSRRRPTGRRRAGWPDRARASVRRRPESSAALGATPSSVSPPSAGQRRSRCSPSVRRPVAG